MTQNAHDFSFDNLEGGALALKDYKGKVVLVVNTASRCGFSVQYGPLRELQSKYGKLGFTVIGVPSNDFNQEPLEGSALSMVCKEKFLVNFPLAAKTGVKGKAAHPFYQWAREKGGFLSRPKYNFHKYLIGRDGEFISSFTAFTSPTARKLVRQIERALGQK